jgi:hypothetical protein
MTDTPPKTHAEKISRRGFFAAAGGAVTALAATRHADAQFARVPGVNVSQDPATGGPDLGAMMGDLSKLQQNTAKIQDELRNVSNEIAPLVKSGKTLETLPADIKKKLDQIAVEFKSLKPVRFMGMSLPNSSGMINEGERINDPSVAIVYLPQQDAFVAYKNAVPKKLPQYENSPYTQTIEPPTSAQRAGVYKSGNARADKAAIYAAAEDFIRNPAKGMTGVPMTQPRGR